MHLGTYAQIKVGDCSLFDAFFLGIQMEHLLDLQSCTKVGNAYPPLVLAPNKKIPRTGGEMHGTDGTSAGRRVWSCGADQLHHGVLAILDLSEKLHIEYGDVAAF